MPLYGVLDCAVADWVFPAVQAEGANRSLFSGALDPDLATATPHLVELRDGSPLLARMNGAEARAAHCGILCQSDLSLWDLRLWLRRHLQAMLPDGRVVLFRFYDPRVLSIWLASLTPEDLATWFGPVSQWWVPLPDCTLSLTLDASGLVQLSQPLAAPVA
jgi:hypothetical protein